MLQKLLNIKLTNWKVAPVIPLFKDEKAEVMDNYRPISILSTFSKLLERVVHFQLYAFLTRNKIVHPYQCGFRKGYSTESAVIDFTDSIRRPNGSGKLDWNGICRLYLRKAFDTVDNTILLSKLHTYGIEMMRWHGLRTI